MSERSWLRPKVYPGASLILIAARARRRPGRWLLTVLGVSLAVAFAGAVAAEGTIAGDLGAHSVLASLSPLDRTVRVTWQGAVTPSVTRRARELLVGLGAGDQTAVELMNPVRLGGVLVRPAALDPLGAWIGAGHAQPASPCRARLCPVLLAGGSVTRQLLAAAGVRLEVTGTTTLRSAVPLGSGPQPSSGEPPLLLSGDVAGLDALAGLSGVYRTHSWLGVLPIAGLQSWQLAALKRRLQRAQSTLLASASQFTLTAPYAGLAAARAQASAAPSRLLLVGGGALALLAMFTVLVAGALRHDQRADVERLRAAGARTGQCVVFALGEAAWLCGFAALAGAGLAVAIAALLAASSSLPVGGVLSHSILTPVGAAALLGGWICATALVGLVLLGSGGRLPDALAVAAVASLALVFASGRAQGATGPLAVLLAPLCCLAAGVLTFRAASAFLRAAGGLARRGPPLGRLALVNLARAPALPSLAIAFIAVSVGLAGFALAYRATLLRGTSDQAAAQVPLDATVSPAADFTTALELAPLTRWRTIAGGPVFPVRRTYASFELGDGAVTVPALGVPAGALARMRGWRASDGSAPLSALARRLTPAGPDRVAGPILPARARLLSLRLSAPSIAVTVTADLRDGAGDIRQLLLGAAAARPRIVHAALPRGRWELEALELDEPTGLDITNAHRNAENPAATTQFQGTVSIGPLRALTGSGARASDVPVGEWRGVGAAAVIRPHGEQAVVRFAESGEAGILRPEQPSDVRPVPVLVDPQTAAAAAGSGRIALSVDGLPVSARVAGVLRRFPTLTAGTAGFVVANQSVLASALDAELPGQGRPDELWISAPQLQRLRTALRTGPLSELGAAFRADIEHRLRSAPIARGVLRTLVAASALSGALALIGLLMATLGAARDQGAERDLAGQGVGPRGLRRELRLRLSIAAAVGVCAGVGIGIGLTPLAVVAVRAAGTVNVPRPALVTVVPWGELEVAGLMALVALVAAGFVATAPLFRERRGT